MNGNENTLLGLLTGGRFMTSGDLPTGKQVVSDLLQSAMEAEQRSRGMVLAEAGTNIFGQPTQPFTQGDIQDLVMGMTTSSNVVPSLTRVLKNMTKTKTPPRLSDVIRATPRTMEEATQSPLTGMSSIDRIKNVLGKEQVKRFQDYGSKFKEFESKPFDADEFQKLALEKEELLKILRGVEEYTQKTLSGGRPLMELPMTPGGLIDKRKSRQEALPRVVSLINKLLE
mgnify:FL=1